MKRSLLPLVVILAALFYFQDSYAQTYTSSSGIVRSGSSGSYTYSVIPGRGDRPVCYVNWYDAARFCNWLHNGKGSGDTEQGAYNFAAGDSDDPRGYDDDLTNDPVAHESGTLFWIPTANEWYKAAYYSSAGTYYDYPTGSNNEPIAEPPPGGQNSGNYLHENPPEYGPTGTEDVGSYINSPSLYGTYDQCGNVSEWIETTKDSEGTRPIVGSDWDNGGSGDANAYWEDYPEGVDPSAEWIDIGFRVAVSPTATIPTAWMMLKNNSPRTGLSAVEGSHSVAPVALTWVSIGDAGNASDDTGYGGVSYNYYIGKYEITYSQYCEFLNAVAATDSHSLFNGNMGTTVTPNYINLAVTPATVVPGGPVTLAYACDFTTWPYQGVSVDVYIAAIYNPKVADAGSSVSDALAGGKVYLFGKNMKSVYVYKGKLQDPTFSNVAFPPVPLAAPLPVFAPRGSSFAGNYVFATAFRYHKGSFVRTDLPVENSNLFTIQ